MGKNNNAGAKNAPKPAVKPQAAPVVPPVTEPQNSPAQPPVVDDPNLLQPDELNTGINPETVVPPVQPTAEPPVVEPEKPVVPPVNESDKPSSKFSDHLKATLEKNPHITNAWVNEKGEWYYSAKAGFTSYSREEILNG